jgi:hypothetical protein
LSDAVALSVTCFPQQHTCSAAFYGCTEDTIIGVCRYLNSFEAKGFHPLAIPMVFAELERRRLVDELELERVSLEQKLLDMDGSDKIPSSRDEKTSAKESPGEQPSESARLWLSVSRLKNSLENWKTHLSKIISHCTSLSRREFATNAEITQTGMKIEARLDEMVTECDANIRDCQTLLDGMMIATQLVSTRAC